MGGKSAATRHLWIMLAVLGSGWVLASTTGIASLTDSSAYPLIVSALLAVGLYGSTSGIDLAEARHDLRTLLLAVTVGVLAKAALIAPVVWLAAGDPAYMILAVAVAQIDPLSVAALRSRSRMSERGKNVLSVWSSFDDPVTVLLTAYLAPAALRALDGVRDSSALPVTPGTYLLTTLGNAVLVVLAALAWWLLRPREADSGTTALLRSTACLLVLGGALVAATAHGLMLGVAVVGLFYRPPMLLPVLGPVLGIAYHAALLALGMLLIKGVEPLPGLALGAAAFGAQAAVGWALTRNLDRYDRVSLALSQQNGVTAVVLALSLEPAFPRTVAITAPAIVTVNVLHFVANELWRRRQPPSVEPGWDLPDWEPPEQVRTPEQELRAPIFPTVEEPGPPDLDQPRAGSDGVPLCCGSGLPEKAATDAPTAEGEALAAQAHLALRHLPYDICGCAHPGRHGTATLPSREAGDRGVPR